ncbi:2-oxoacid:acceptor oxidoreductase family protein [Vibrio sp. SS-MA-C1-2]|uniref:2-oxoacid:acceptor oxidoreductase family protein n=1 Tax=Vibrio sp. SS-MA-C1-2 TaxID=2908646 RepID=UPI001F170291|nr:2-oxoacid:acceptor oxidoreductase family protein [Vibrio sp. SS-MA-C1-2]UJF17977.1 2-oxoacid:acceptor oxidoreductase family protein [Vibrio sp. SS-MA-C1-2]
MVNFDIPSLTHQSIISVGRGSDGSVGAAKSTTKLIGETTGLFAQANFIYDSKKSGGMTTSHIRISQSPIQSTYPITQADYLSISDINFIANLKLETLLRPSSVILINTHLSIEALWTLIPTVVQEALINNNNPMYLIDASAIAYQSHLGNKVNTILQMSLLAVMDQVNTDQAKKALLAAINKSYGKKGQAIVDNNIAAVNATLDQLMHVSLKNLTVINQPVTPLIPTNAPDFVQKVTAKLLEGEGDSLPVSMFPVDGSWPTDTAKWEKRDIASHLPIWDQDLCTQCGYCTVVCPHSAIRAKYIEPETIVDCEDLLTVDAKGRDNAGLLYSLQVSVDDCTGCEVCVQACPAKDRKAPDHKALNMVAKPDVYETEKRRYQEFEPLQDSDIESLRRIDVKSIQTVDPMFEFSGACSGCGETGYIKLLTQMFGDHLYIANSTGCSSIYGGNLPTTPYTKNEFGQGPAWANSLFEDNAEFGLGFRLAADQNRRRALRLLDSLENQELKQQLTDIYLDGEYSNAEQQHKLSELASNFSEYSSLKEEFDHLREKAVWIVGGDGWAYDIGFGGVDHVLNQQDNINILVMDTQCYSNTGGQHSKASLMGTSSKLATNTKIHQQKQLVEMYVNNPAVYVAQISLGANMNQTIKALKEAADWNGPSIVVAYSPCIEHGYELSNSLTHSKLATESGIWPLFRTLENGSIRLDSKQPKQQSLEELVRAERRFTLSKQDQDLFQKQVNVLYQACEENFNRLTLSVNK